MKLVEHDAPTRAATFVPGVGGYVIAAVIGWTVFAIGLMLPSLDDYGVVEGLGVVIVYVPLVLLACSTYGLPVAVLAVLVVHLGCRRTGAGWVHVLAAGVVTGLLTWAWLALTFPGEDLGQAPSWMDREAWPATLAGISAAIGRAAAHRWVPRR